MIVKLDRKMNVQTTKKSFCKLCDIFHIIKKVFKWETWQLLQSTKGGQKVV